MAASPARILHPPAAMGLSAANVIVPGHGGAFPADAEAPRQCVIQPQTDMPASSFSEAAGSLTT